VTVALEIDGQTVRVPEGTRIYDAAAALGIEIPVLCHDPRLEPAGVCRICAVEVEGERALAAACVREVQDGMVVRTQNDRVTRNRSTLLGLLMAEQPATSVRQETTADDLLFALAQGESGASWPQGDGRGRDESSLVIAVDHQACILCDRCIRACSDLQHNDVIARSGKGYGTRIAFDLSEEMGASSCVSCGECAASCPTGALTHRPVERPLAPRESLRPVDSVCPYCGVGCTVRFHVDDSVNRVVLCDGRESPGSRGRLCVKGRYGFDYVSHPQRLTKPLIRIDYPKRPLSREVQAERRKRGRRGVVDYDEVMPAFREASWDEALELVASRFVALREEHGSDALAGFASAKGSNEDAFLFQKLVRTGFGTNNVDHCARLCHASSVTALLETIGSGAVTTTFGDIANADVALVTGTDTTSNHPVAATFFKDAAARGTRLIVVDPRHSPIADHAWRFCQIRSGTDVAFYSAVMHEVIARGWVDEAFVASRTQGFEAVAEAVQPFTPEVASGFCGVTAETIREVAAAYGQARAAVTYWGMGMSQHSHGTENCRAIISLCLMTGNIGR